jgi:16S rRNA C967 or C1407 C5-methylase (RsmB/RsmF family)/NOL1/NOP2/fmu family ribosome biogenesis protein
LSEDQQSLHIPPSILADLKKVKGFDEQSFVDAHDHKPPVTIRKHPLKGAELFGGNDAIPWCENGLYLPERPVFTLDPAFHAGGYYVQEASSMFLEQLLKPELTGRAGLRVLDLCAAPGGKSTHIASLLDSDSLLISNEVIRTRAAILEENISRWGYMNTWVTGNDPRDFGRINGYFDIIVADAPCSGSGLWRKDKAALNEWSEANVQMCQARQQRILADVWPSLKENGLLIYATCSFSPQENEDVLDWMGTELDATSIRVPLQPEWGIEPTQSPNKQMQGYRFFPDKVRGEGFFIAGIRKTGKADNPKIPRFRPEHHKDIAGMTGHLLETSDYTIIKPKEDGYNFIHRQHEQDVHILSQAVYVRKAGLEAGNPAGRDWLPGHDIALCTDLSKTVHAFDVSREQALKFLKREEMAAEVPAKGWYVVKYNGLGLGWIKSLGIRMNNYLPKNLRIRMDID